MEHINQQKEPSKNNQSLVNKDKNNLNNSELKSVNDDIKDNKTTQLKSKINSSPQVKGATSLQNKINNSPLMIAQRKRLENLFGNPVQRQKEEEEKVAQKKEENSSNSNISSVSADSNPNGLPQNLKSGIESLSGISMNDVKVNYNSDKPSALQAHAFAQGNEIHISPGQEKHLPHEAWHVVQQRQGRVKPTVQKKGIALNDESSLEKEADEMGAKALSVSSGSGLPPKQFKSLTSDNVIQAKMKANDFKSLVTEQEALQKDVKQNPDKYKGAYTTVGFEHEFAQMTDGPLQGASHVEITKSEEKMPYTGLPFILETDASNALELVTPPFLIETLPNVPVPEPDEVEKVDAMIKKTLLTHSQANPNLLKLVQDFRLDPGISFPLAKIQIERKNMTPKTKDEVFNKWNKNNAKVSRNTLENISLVPSKKGAKNDEEVHISTHVNFATDAHTYDMMQELHKNSGGNSIIEGYLEIENSLKETMLGSIFKSELPDIDLNKKGMIQSLESIRDSADKQYLSIEAMLQSDLSRLNLSEDEDAGKTAITINRAIKTREIQNPRNNFISKSREIISKLNNPVIKPSEIIELIDQYKSALDRLRQAMLDVGKRLSEECETKKVLAEKDFLVYDEIFEKAKSSGKNVTVITGSSNPNLKIFINSLARTLGGLYAIHSIDQVKRAQENRYSDPTKSMESVSDHAYMSSKVKDVKQVWIKDTIMNIGLGILQPNDWVKVYGLVTNKDFINKITNLKQPEKFSYSVASRDDFNVRFIAALNTIGNYITQHKLTETNKSGSPKTNTSALFLSPKKQPELFTHKAKHIGARQDTFISASKVQMPIWKGKRLHVVESRDNTIERLKQIKKIHEGSSTDKDLKPIDDSSDLSILPPHIDDDKDYQFEKERNLHTFSIISKEFMSNHKEDVMKGSEDLPEGIVHPSNSDPENSGRIDKENLSKERVKMIRNNDSLGIWLTQNGISVAHNSGRGCNCLIISLLQHATGNYSSEHNSKAKEYRDKLILRFKDVREGEMLYSDNPAFIWLVGEINKDFNLSMNVILVQSDSKGRPFIAPQNKTGDDNTIIWDKGGHYEALYSTK